MNNDERFEIEGLDDYDRARASDMEENCPIYPALVALADANEEVEREAA